MTFTDELFRAAQPIWQAQLDHPFVRGIADGTLEESRFRRWVLQDHLYLQDFARLLAWAVVKADRLESMTWFATLLHLTLATEMELHRRYAARFGIDAAALESQVAWPTTRAYGDFLLRTAAEQDLAGLVAALLPCAWGYVHIGRHLAAGERPADGRYADWIDQYASAEFRQAADWLKAEMERLAGPLDPSARRRLVDLFVLSSRYEWRFWEMCWHGEGWSP